MRSPESGTIGGSRVAVELPGIATAPPDKAACRRASCSGESEERITRPRKRDISAITFSGCALRTSTNNAELLDLSVLPTERMKLSLMP